MPPSVPPCVGPVLALIAVALLGCAPPPRVPDGDKLLIGSTHYQLWGIEAPGLHQTCDDDWPAGQQAQIGRAHV